MCDPGVDTRKLWVALDVPEELSTTTKDGLKKIGPKCLKLNAEIILRMYEGMCIKHVLKNTAKTKSFERLVKRDPRFDPSKSKESKSLPNCVLAESSLLGGDPWGDEPLPKPTTNDDGEEEFTTDQVLMIDLQEKVYEYLTAHVHTLIEGAILTRVRAQEKRYENNEDRCKELSNRQRMPWSSYKKTITKFLPGMHGEHELCSLVALQREDGESAQDWGQRLNEGKVDLEKREGGGNKLSNAIYSALFLKDLLNVEVTSMCTTLQTEL